MNVEEINDKIRIKEQEIAALKAEIRNAEIAEGKAYTCLDCKNTVTVDDYDKGRTWVTMKLCYSCHRKRRDAEKKRDIENKLIGGIIIDIATQNRRNHALKRGCHNDR